MLCQCLKDVLCPSWKKQQQQQEHKGLCSQENAHIPDSFVTVNDFPVCGRRSCTECCSGWKALHTQTLAFPHRIWSPVPELPGEMCDHVSEFSVICSDNKLKINSTLSHPQLSIKLFPLMSLYRTNIQALFAKTRFDTSRRIHSRILLSLYPWESSYPDTLQPLAGTLGYTTWKKWPPGAPILHNETNTLQHISAILLDQILCI